MKSTDEPMSMRWDACRTRCSLDIRRLWARHLAKSSVGTHLILFQVSEAAGRVFPYSCRVQLNDLSRRHLPIDSRTLSNSAPPSPVIVLQSLEPHRAER